MARLPIDTMSQTRLIYELRLAIDRARHADESSLQWETAVGRLMTLVVENPTASLRKHVLHNLGCARRAWLRQLAAKLPNGHAALLVDQMGGCR